MTNTEVLLKKTCSYAQTENLVYVKQLLVISENGEKRLALRLVNERAERVSSVTVSVELFDADGDKICTNNVRLDVPPASGVTDKPFVPERKIVVSDKTCDVVVKVLSADYGDYTYRADGNSVNVEYNGGENDLEDTPTESKTKYAAKAGKSGITVTRKTMRVPALVVIALIAALAFAVAAVCVHLFYFVKTEKTFLYSGVIYAFEDGDSSDGSDIYVAGYHGSKSRIVIPKQIEGHTVTRIDEGAFANDTELTSISFSSDIPVGEYAFRNCKNLRTVDFEHITEFGMGAFSGCEKLSSVTVMPHISLIPQEAFSGCTSLTQVIVSESDEPIKIGHKAFAYCTSIKNLDFGREIDFEYRNGEHNFFEGSSIGRLHLLSFDAELEENTIHSLFGIKPNSGKSAQIGELSIDVLDFIPADFCSDSAITSFTVKNIQNTDVADRAFANCAKLARFDINASVTSVGEYAFLNTALTAFDGNALSALAPYAFAESDKLAAVTLSQNTGLTEIGEYAFSMCSALTAITIPSGITSIPESLFYGCSALAEVKFARGTKIESIQARAFKDCTSLAEFVVPDDSLTYIGEYAFSNCSALKNIELPDKLAMIGGGAFEYCTSLTEFVVPDSVSVVGSGALTGCSSLGALTVPFVGYMNGNKDFLSYTFGSPGNDYVGKGYVPASLKTVTITKAEKLNTRAFYGCADIETVNLPSGLTSIGAYAFTDCTSLVNAEIPDTVKSIGTYAFRKCGFTAFTVPDSVTLIERGAFNGCNSLSTLNIPFAGGSDTSSAYLSYVFGGSSNTDSSVFPESLTELNITSAVYLGDNALFGAAWLKEVNLPDTLKYIGNRAFSNCNAMTSIVIPDSVYSIGSEAFGGCNALERLSTPFVGGVRADSALEYDTLYTLYYMFGNYDVPRSLRTVILTDSSVISCSAFIGGRYVEQIVLDCDVRVIGNDAFSSCYRLNEVFNYGSLNVVKGDSGNGGIARDVLAVHTDRDEAPLPQTETSSGYRFIFDGDGNAYLIDYKGDSETLSLPASVLYDGKRYDKYAVWQYLFNNDFIVNTVNIPAAVTSVGKFAFSACFALEKVTYAAQSPITSIEQFTFAYCRKLYDLTLPQNISFIGENAFASCVRLKKFYLPQTIRAGGIATDAFIGCGRLFEIYNFSNLNIVAGSSDNGRIAENARAVHGSVNESIESVIVNDVQYMKLGDNGIDWWAVDFYGMNVLEIKCFTANGQNINKIGIYSEAFKNYDNIETVVLSNAVAEIDPEIFLGCNNLSSITLVDDGGANSTVSIAENAFIYCPSLAEFKSETAISTIGKNAFSQCGSLRSVEFTKKVNSIASSAFAGSPVATAVFAEVTEVGEQAFYNCKSLTSVTFGNADTIGASAFEGDTALRSVRLGTVNTIAAKAFYGDSAMTSVAIAAGQTMSIGDSAFENSAFSAFGYSGYISSIGEKAFSGNSRLRSVTLGSVGSIGNSAFGSCDILSSVAFAGNVDVIGNNAFYGTPLSSISFGGDVGSIGENAFRSCSLQSLSIPGNVNSIGEGAFMYNSIASVTFDGNVGSIGNSAFAYNYGLSRLQFNGTLTALGESAFAYISITELVLPDTLRTIPSYAFAYNGALHKITLPRNLTSIAEYAFSGCSYILTVYNKSSYAIPSSVNLGDVLVVTDDASKAEITYSTVGEFEFVNTSKGWYLYSVTSYSGIIMLPKTFNSNGTKVESYGIRQYSVSYGDVNILVEKSATSISDYAFGYSGVDIYYAGTAAEWNTLVGNRNVAQRVTLYVYSDCLHDNDGETMWRYNAYGFPTRENTEFAESDWTVTKQPTCVEEGEREVVCTHCGRKFTEALPTIDHNIGADGKCTMCGITEVKITSANISNLEWFTNDENYPFTIGADGTIKSNNKAANSVSTFTVKADAEIIVKFIISASSEASHDRGTVYINGDMMVEVSGVRSTYFMAVLNSGDVLTIKYSKDGSDNRYDDCIYIKDLTVLYREESNDNA